MHYFVKDSKSRVADIQPDPTWEDPVVSPRFGYPVALDLHGVVVLVVGAGPVAARKVAGLAAASRDPAMIGKLERFRDSAPPDERRGVERRIAQIRERLSTEPRLAREIGEWLGAR